MKDPVVFAPLRSNLLAARLLVLVVAIPIGVVVALRPWWWVLPAGVAWLWLKLRFAWTSDVVRVSDSDIVVQRRRFTELEPDRIPFGDIRSAELRATNDVHIPQFVPGTVVVTCRARRLRIGAGVRDGDAAALVKLINERAQAGRL
jgi:hypothetical protein